MGVFRSKEVSLKHTVEATHRQLSGESSLTAARPERESVKRRQTRQSDSKAGTRIDTSPAPEFVHSSGDEAAASRQYSMPRQKPMRRNAEAKQEVGQLAGKRKKDKVVGDQRTLQEW